MVETGVLTQNLRRRIIIIINEECENEWVREGRVTFEDQLNPMTKIQRTNLLGKDEGI